MEREKYDDTIRRDSIGIARAAMNAAAAETLAKPAFTVMPAERLTSTGRAIEIQTTDVAPSPSEPK